MRKFDGECRELKPGSARSGWAGNHPGRPGEPTREDDEYVAFLSHLSGRILAP
jgi:hypothetical protein